MPPSPVDVRWQIAVDERFRRVVREGRVTATPELAHSVHAEVTGLRPRARYFYRFIAGDVVSPVGRTQTLPEQGRHVGEFALAVACCARFEEGYYVAYRDMAAQELDLVIHVGDYIYENFYDTGVRASQVPADQQRTVSDLTGYRLRHALGKSDPDLRAAHAAHPWAMILDNHDAVEDDHRDPATLARRAAAYQAYYEHMPMRRTSLPDGPSMQIYHRIAVGDLIELDLLDTRQFRDDETVCGQTEPPNIGPRCSAGADPAHTMLGSEQEQWLTDGLARSSARWNAIVQTVLFAPFNFAPNSPTGEYYDSGWNGYPAERQRILDAIDTIGPSNPLMFSGDWHTAWVNNLNANAEDLSSKVLATEFAATAVSSDPAFTDQRSRPEISANADVRYYDARNGYIRCRADHRHWHTDFVTVDAKDPASTANLASRWVLEAGRAVAQRA
jgi:alkaline phosphatase D